jgi:hypothetical protein
MSLQVSADRPVLGDEIHLTFFVRAKKGKPTRVAFANLLDMAVGGLCMEISPLDSDLFMESHGKLFILNRDIEIQIFCRSHPSNVFIAGHVKWFKRKKEFEESVSDDNIYLGVTFSFESSLQREEIAGLLGHMGNETIRCQNCEARISAEAALCYNCGVKLVRKRTLLRRMIFGLLAGGEEK